MRVLLATDSFPPGCGGSGWSTFELAKGLRARGHEVLVFQPRPGEAGRRRDYEGFDVIEHGAPAPNLPFVRNYFKNERLYASLRKTLAHLVTDSGIDIVHAGRPWRISSPTPASTSSMRSTASRVPRRSMARTRRAARQSARSVTTGQSATGQT